MDCYSSCSISNQWSSLHAREGSSRILLFNNTRAFSIEFKSKLWSVRLMTSTTFTTDYARCCSQFLCWKRIGIPSELFARQRYYIVFQNLIAHFLLKCSIKANEWCSRIGPECSYMDSVAWLDLSVGTRLRNSNFALIFRRTCFLILVDRTVNADLLLNIAFSHCRSSYLS